MNFSCRCYAMMEMFVTGTAVDADRSFTLGFYSRALVFRFVGPHVIKMHQLECYLLGARKPCDSTR